MPQAFGFVSSEDSFAVTGGGSGNFSVTRTAAGVFQVVVNDPQASDNGTMTVTVNSRDLTDNAVVEIGSACEWTVYTGSTGQGGANYKDLDFSFIVMW